jgi:hypothetical protein
MVPLLGQQRRFLPMNLEPFSFLSGEDKMVCGRASSCVWRVFLYLRIDMTMCEAMLAIGIGNSKEIGFRRLKTALSSLL